MAGPLHLRVFLSSPGDVADERNLARRLLKDELPVDPFLRDRVTLDVIAWDDPAAHIPMLANLTPQESVNRGMARPCNCDIVVVVLWSRMGTPLPDAIRKPGGEPYLSGTEWEYEDACNARPQPEILVYRRTEEPKIGLADPKWEEKREQYARVERFFERFRNPDGLLGGGYEKYATPAEFAEKLEGNLRSLLARRLADFRHGQAL